ncbi:hypothetical protein SDC9_06298 [bioreactor metagenome]|uniref:Uncharacterized protein n=1 Tax=bioreactor metagenome TaxID=1076179 RepID=A0A644T2L2_9ZZZZ
MRERPQAQFLLRHPPELGEAMRLGDQEDDDEPAHDHQLDMGGEVGGPAEAADEHVFQKHRQQHQEGRPGEGAEDRAKPADDHHEEDQEGLVDAEGLADLGRAEIDREEQRPGDADEERADGEGGDLGGQRVHPDDLGGDVHVADRHPLAADGAAGEIAGDQRDEGQQDQAEHVFRRGRGLRAGDEDAEHAAVGRGDLARGRIVVEPRHLVEEPDQEELRGKRRHGQVEALDPQRGQTEEHAHGGGDAARKQNVDEDRNIRESGHQLVDRIGAHGHETAGAKADLPGIAHQDVQPDRRDRVDQEGHEDRIRPVVVDDERDHAKGHGQRDIESHAVEADREGLVVLPVARLEITCLAVEHQAFPPLNVRGRALSVPLSSRASAAPRRARPPRHRPRPVGC